MRLIRLFALPVFMFLATVLEYSNFDMAELSARFIFAVTTRVWLA